MEKDLEGFGVVVAVFHAFEQSIQRGIGGECRHREQPDQSLKASHSFDACHRINV